MKFLIIEDDTEIIETIDLLLTLRWPESSLVSTTFGKKGVELAQEETPDVIIMDLGLPDLTGFQVLDQIRRFSDVPILMLTVRGEEASKVRALELGADDYVTKPFSSSELMARLGAISRRRQSSEHTNDDYKKLFMAGKLRIDLTSQEVSIDDELIRTSPKEYALIQLFLTEPNTVITKEYILSKIFKGEDNTREYFDDYLKRLISSIKEILEIKASNPPMIFQIEDEGYKFVKPL